MSNTKPFKPDDAYARLADFERRLKALETAPRLGLTTFTPPGATYPVFSADETGLVLPSIPIPLVPQSGTGLTASATSVSATDASFQSVYAGEAFAAIADAYMVTFAWATDAATTGEVRLKNNVGGGGVTSVVSLAAGSGGFLTFSWLHGQPLGTGPFAPTLQARRTGGAGGVGIFVPGSSWFAGSAWSAATATGI